MSVESRHPVGLRCLRATLVLAVLFTFGLAPVRGEETEEVDLTELSLVELLDVPVTSVSRKAQSLLEAAAAVHVLTGDEIRRSGATTIPDALRYVPGVQVARIDANKWAVSVRGFNGRFSNKLLVLIDGRIVYTPLFSGVFWDVQDTNLDDVERIEVIRGPGATLWGANAVNGVINIITKNAGETRGGLLNVGAGDEEKAFGTFRYGGAAGDRGSYRVFGKWFDRDGDVDLAGSAVPDDWDVSRIGFRGDWSLDRGDTLSIRAEVYQGDIGERLNEPSPASLVTVADSVQDVDGYFLMGQWARDQGAGRGLSASFSYSQSDRDSALFDEERDTLDLNFQQRAALGARHDVIWGAEYQLSDDRIGDNFAVNVDPSSRDLERFGVFLQDEIRIRPEVLHIIVGTKVEHNDYTDWEIQPNLRLLWRPTEEHTAWASIARAVRTPSRAEREGRAIVPVGAQPPGAPMNPFPLPLYPAFVGDGALEAENLIAYEAGYRVQATDNLVFDVTAFFNDYDDLRGIRIGVPVCEASGLPAPLGCLGTDTNIIAPLLITNDVEGDGKGLEWAADWRAAPRWRLRGGYSYLDLSLGTPAAGAMLAAGIEGTNPKQQAFVQSFLQVGRTVHIDVGVRFMDRLPDVGIDGYLTADVRIGWRPRERLELYLVGQNLLDDEHQEFISELGEIPPTQIETSVFGGVRWQF